MSPTVKRVLRVAFPLLTGIGVLLILLLGPLRIGDVTGAGVVQSIDADSRILHVLESDQSLAEVQPSWLVDTTEQPKVGEAVEWRQPGLASTFAQLPWWCPVGVLLMTLVALLVQVLRLRLMLRAAGIECTRGACLRAHFVGLFYGNIIPAGQVGGDPIKAWILASAHEVRLGSAMAAVIADRLMGLAVLAALALVALSIGVADQRYGNMLWWVGGMVAVASIGTLLLVSRRARRVAGLRGVSIRLRRWDRTATAAEALRTLGQNRRLLLAGIGLSVVGQGLLIGAAVLVGIGLELDQVGLMDYFALVPPATVASSVPGSAPGGWGVGEGAFVLLFGGIGVAAEAAFLLSAVPRLAIALLSLAGLPAAIRRKR